MRAISGYYPYHAHTATASSAQLTRMPVVGGVENIVENVENLGKASPHQNFPLGR